MKILSAREEDLEEDGEEIDMLISNYVYEKVGSDA